MLKLNKQGFTLIEVLVVVLIIAILSSLALPRYFVNVEIARSRSAIDYGRLWQGARQIYFAKNGSYPAHTEEGSKELVLDAYPDTNLFTLQYITGALVFKRTSGDYKIKVKTDNTLYCCYPGAETSRGAKICTNIASGEIVAGEAFDGNKCREILETE